MKIRKHLASEVLLVIEGSKMSPRLCWMVCMFFFLFCGLIPANSTSS